MLVRRATMLPLECIVRGRLAGQAFDEYVAKGTVHEMAAARAALTDPFPEPIFTPSTKAASDTTSTSTCRAAASSSGERCPGQAQTLCLDLFTRAAAKLATSV
jgi:phosphoribosylaminoimidazole-succinocarboxamide synthase